MCDVQLHCDVAVLPRWLKVSQASITSPASIHDSIVRRPCLFSPGPLSAPPAKSGNCPRAWVAQLHLALVMAIDAKLLVLDDRPLASTFSIANILRLAAP